MKTAIPFHLEISKAKQYLRAAEKALGYGDAARERAVAKLMEHGMKKSDAQENVMHAQVQLNDGF